MDKWETAARKIQRQDSCELESLPGARIVRRKFTVEAQEGLLGQRQGIELDESGVPVNIQEGELRAFHQHVIVNGLLEMWYKDPDDGDATEERVDISAEDFFDKISAYADIESEMFSRILEYNRPLAETSDSPSRSAPNGSRTEPGSDQEKPSPTGESRTQS